MALKVLGLGLLLIVLGFALMPVAQGQESTPAPRATSIFDQPAQQAAPTVTPAPAGDSGAATRVPSIFDQQQTAAAPTGGATRVPSLFDSQAQPTPAAPAGGAAPIGSIFDTVQADVIRFEGEGVPSREYCLSCHANEFLQMTLPSGEVVPVGFDEAAYDASVHGQHGTTGYLCIRCHEGMNEYPHAEVTAATARELTVEMSTSCSRCHTDKYDETLDGVHFAQLAAGNQNAAVCSDCHGGHEVQALTELNTGERLEDASSTSIEMCAGCHAEVYARFTESVHGSAVLEDNPDAPTCTDCHGVHDTQGPSANSSFKLFSPQTCATCHADEAMMARYDISTDVFSTYVADFHGTTVAIFQQTGTDQAFNTPVCVDCHGVHNIMAVDAESSPVLKDNLVTTCQRCHPGATSNFPDSWMSHYAPSLERTPLTTIASVAYAIMIPAVIGGLGMFVITDVRRRRHDRREEENEHGE